MSETNEILKHEIEILTCLNFNINVPTIHTFLCRYLKAGNATIKIVQTCCYICERMLQDAYYHKYLPSEIAAASVYIAKNGWSDVLTYHTNYSKDYIKTIADEMRLTIYNTHPDRKAVFRKYKQPRFGEVALISFESET